MKQGIMMRFGGFVLCVGFAVIPALIAMWLGSYGGLLIGIIYWFFCVWAIAAVLMGVWAVITGEFAEDMGTLFWIAFFLNIPLQLLVVPRL